MVGSARGIAWADRPQPVKAGGTVAYSRYALTGCTLPVRTSAPYDSEQFGARPVCDSALRRHPQNWCADGQTLDITVRHLR